MGERMQEPASNQGYHRPICKVVCTADSSQVSRLRGSSVLVTTCFLLPAHLKLRPARHKQEKSPEDACAAEDGGSGV